MTNCMLCLSKTLKRNSLETSKEQLDGSTVEDVIKIHFWFFSSIQETSTTKKPPIICLKCWSKLEAFHEFFNAIKSCHNIEDQTTTQNFPPNEIFVKTEETFETPAAVDASDFQPASPSAASTASSDQLQEKPSRKRKKETKTAKSSEKKQKFDVSNEELDVLRVHTELRCEKCSKDFTDWQDIRAHYRREHKVIGYVRCCGRKIDRCNEVKDHVSWHLNPHIFQCHACGKSAISREHLRLHEEIHIPDSDRAFACEKCDKRFVNRYNLNMHAKVHEKDDKAATIPCGSCAKLFKTERQLKSHVAFCHKDAASAWICHVCSKALKNKYTLEIHVRAHTNPDDPVECEKCGHVLKNKRRHAIHMAKHRSEEAGPYECERGCGKVFKHRPAMLDHVAFVHTAKRFACSTCAKEFKHKKALEEHEASQHAGLDLYACPFCERTFKSSANMHAHKKRAHPNEYRQLPAPSYLRGGTIGDYCDTRGNKN